MPKVCASCPILFDVACVNSELALPSFAAKSPRNAGVPALASAGTSVSVDVVLMFFSAPSVLLYSAKHAPSRLVAVPPCTRMSGVNWKLPMDTPDTNQICSESMPRVTLPVTKKAKVRLTHTRMPRRRYSGGYSMLTSRRLSAFALLPNMGTLALAGVSMIQGKEEEGGRGGGGGGSAASDPGSAR
jgi:hypothetical protein